MTAIAKLLRPAIAACLVALLGACATRTTQDAPTQRFEAALRGGSEKLAAGDATQAALAFEQAERVAALYDRRALRLQALFAIGATAATREDDARARQAYGDALELARSLGDAHGVGVALTGLAESDRRAGALDAALAGLDRALAPEALRPGSPERMQARMARALVWNASGRANEALAELVLLEQVARSSMPAMLSGALANQASVLRTQGQSANALVKATQALAIDRDQASPFTIAADLELLARLYQDARQPQQARESAQSALRIAQATGQVRLVQRMQDLLKALP